jgi:hypothetical protein
MFRAYGYLFTFVIQDARSHEIKILECIHYNSYINVETVINSDV